MPGRVPRSPDTARSRRATSARARCRRRAPPRAACSCAHSSRENARTRASSASSFARRTRVVAHRRTTRARRRACARASVDERVDAAGAREVLHAVERDVDRIDRHRRRRRVRRRLARGTVPIGSSISAVEARRAPASAPAARGPAARRCPSSWSTAAENSGTITPACRARHATSLRHCGAARDGRRRRTPPARAAGSRRGRPRRRNRRSSRDARARGRRRAARSTSASSDSVAGTRKHGRPAAFGLEQRHRRTRGHGAASAARLRAMRAAIAARIARPARSAPARRPARASTPTGTCRRSPRAARAPRLARVAGPLTTIQPSFSCGRPADFDRPPSTNVSARVSPASDAASRAAPERIVGEDLVGHRARRLALAQSATSQSRSAARSIEPVGLLGLTTSTARVRRR